jgi:hypothetical protein
VDLKDPPEHQDLRVSRELWDQLVLLVVLDLQDQQALQDLKDLKDLKDKRVVLVLKELKVLRVVLDCLVLKDHPEHQDRWEYQVNRGQTVNQALPELRDNQAPRVLQEQLELQDLQVTQERLVNLEDQELRDQLVLKDHKVQLGLQDLQGLLDPAAARVL